MNSCFLQMPALLGLAAVIAGLPAAAADAPVLLAPAPADARWGDQGDGTYRNPVLPADYSDLDAIRVGSDYYAISSTFQFSPGMVVLHSRDLVSWRPIGHVVDDLTRISPELGWQRMNCYGRGIWAGAIRYHAGKFWVYFGTPDDGYFMSTAANAAGPWEPVHPVWQAAGWDDCCPFWDDDGQAYLVGTQFARDPANRKRYNIHLFKMSPDGRHLDPASDRILHQSEGSEANKLYKIRGIYYHFYSEVRREGRVVMMNRARSLQGPWETRQLSHNSPGSREPNQGGLIETEKGDWWFLTHLGSGGYWEGRVACLLPVTWVDGWPIPGAVGGDGIGEMLWAAPKPFPGAPAECGQMSDEFDTPRLPPQWEWNYQPRPEKWSLVERPGFLRLHAFRPAAANGGRLPALLRAGNTLTQRSMRTRRNEVTIKLEIGGMADGQQAGLCHFAGTYSTLGVRQAGGIRTVLYDDNGRETAGPRIEGPAVWLRSTWDEQGSSRYAYSVNGTTFIPFGGAYRLGWGHYRGDRVGVFCYNTDSEAGCVDVDWFRYVVTSPSGGSR